MADTWQVSASADDTWERPGVANNYTDARLRIGEISGPTDTVVGLRFAVNIPKDAIIASADLQINVSATNGSGWAWLIYGEAADDCADYSSSAPSGRSLTTAYATWSPGTGTGWKTSPDIASIVSEITARSGWSATNHLCIQIRDNQSGANNQDAYQYDKDSSKAAKLDVNHATPTPTPTVTPTATPTPTPTNTPLCGHVTTDTTWSGDVAIGCNIGVASGVTLTLQPGTGVRFLGPYKMDVYGTLAAIGLPTETISLTSGVSQTAGSWGPLFLLGAGSILDCITVTYGTAIEVAVPATITHAFIASNTIGVDFLAAGALISSTVTGSETGILVRGNVTPTLQAVNILTNTLGLWNAQGITLPLPGLWWGTAVTETIEAMIWDWADDDRLGRVEWWPAAGSAW